MEGLCRSNLCMASVGWKFQSTSVSAINFFLELECCWVGQLVRESAARKLCFLLLLQSEWSIQWFTGKAVGYSQSYHWLSGKPSMSVWFHWKVAVHFPSIMWKFIFLWLPNHLFECSYLHQPNSWWVSAEFEVLFGTQLLTSYFRLYLKIN
jgi:hypothetical protein